MKIYNHFLLLYNIYISFLLNVLINYHFFIRFLIYKIRPLSHLEKRAHDKVNENENMRSLFAKFNLNFKFRLRCIRVVCVCVCVRVKSTRV